jgi:SecD/SecF fusion protein
MKNSKGKGLLGLLILLAAIVLFGYMGYSTMNDIKLGLDLAGGVSITYQAVDDNPSAEDMSDTIYKLQQRVQNYSTEAEVYQEGNNRINIDIPGVSDANAILEELGKPGSLVFTDEEGQVILTGDQVASAKAGIIDQNGTKSYIVSLSFTDEGTTAFAEATTANVGKRIAIIYDNMIYSNPVVREAITGGQCQIDGMDSYEEAENLAATIRIGSLSLELTELRSNVVGAKLGQEAISTSLKAGAIGFGIVVLFMLVVYMVPGLAASIALAIYVGVILILLAAFQVTLTLPGIAGIILSVGMAVDANVIIFTRIKEEIGHGKTVKSAIKTGFEKAMSAIIDGNITTLIAAAVLYFLGSGTVKGFATTLAMGIILSMITALFVTRWAIRALYYIGLENPKLYGVKKDGKVFDFVGKRKICFAISIVMIVIGWAAMGIHGANGTMLNYGMDFTGGTSTNVTFNEDLSLEDISAQVVPKVSEITGDADVQTQKVAGTNEVIIKTKTLTVDQRKALEESMVENFGVEADKITTESISASVSTEMKKDCAIAVIVATILMLLYIWLRFKNINFAASAIICLVHDVLVVMTFYAIARWSIGSTFIACMLTIVGYSINATIVIFDRIRENISLKGPKETLEDIVNKSITQSVTRSINTSLTTFIMVFMLFILGVSSIREFTLPLMVGIVCGTYSSICVAGSLWYVLNKRNEKKKAANK